MSVCLSILGWGGADQPHKPLHDLIKTLNESTSFEVHVSR